MGQKSLLSLSGRRGKSYNERVIHLSIPNLNGNESRYLQECINSNYVSSVGPFVSRMEKLLAEKSGAAAAVTTASGTSALHLALLAVGVKPGDLVIIPSFSFIATANAIAHCAATPWLFDIENRAWTLDAELLRQELHSKTLVQNGKLHLKATGQRIAAVMPVHVLGNPADLDAVVMVASQYDLPVVVDGAAALGATYHSKLIAYPGLLTTFSFNGNKTITCGGGGAVVGDNLPQLDLIRHISAQARVGTSYHHDQVGYNYRLTNIHAAVGCAQLERLEAFVTRKREVDIFYRELSKNLSGLASFARPPWGESSCWFSGIVLDPHSALGVNELVPQLAAQGIESKPFWKPIHLQPPYATAPRTLMSNSESVWTRILTLPCSTNITNLELDQVAKVMIAVFSRKAA